MKYWTRLSLVLTGILAIGSPRVLAEDVGFSASLSLYLPIVLTSVQGLRFPNTPLGSDLSVVVGPESEQAVVFNGIGEPNAGVTVTVVESEILLETAEGSDPSQQIRVDSFTTGGGVSASGQGSFAGNGELNNIRVGATAHVETDDQAGLYAATATLRVTYQ